MHKISILSIIITCVYSTTFLHTLTQQSHKTTLPRAISPSPPPSYQRIHLRIHSQQTPYEQPHSHNYWFNKNHPTDSFLSSARQWNYCDYKCIYLQKYNSNKDFVVVVLGGFLKEDFSACYVKNGEGYTLWKDVTSNKFYQDNCGQDTQDWVKSGQFNIKGVYGTGVGRDIDQEKMYK